MERDTPSIPLDRLIKNSGDDRSVQVGGKQRIYTIDGLLFHAIDLERWPHVPLYPW